MRSILATILLAAALLAQDDAARLNGLFARDDEETLRESPNDATNRFGRHPRGGFWIDLSQEARSRRRSFREQLWSELAKIDRAKLNERNQLDYDLFRHRLQRQVEASRFPDELLAVDLRVRNPVSRFLAVRNLPAETVADYETILARLRRLPEPADQIVLLLEEGIRAGVTLPKPVSRKIAPQLHVLAAYEPAQSPLLEAFTRFPATIPPEERARLTKEAHALLDGTVNPALRKFERFLVEKYVPASRDEAGRSALPNGAAWYAAMVKVETTSSLTPAEIHAIGLREVKRIHDAMLAVKAKAAFEGDLAAFHKFMQTDPQFFFKTAEEVLAAYRDIAKRIDPELMRLFGKLPRATYGVRAMDAYRAPSSPPAFFQPGDRRGTRPGWFEVNVSDLLSHPRWGMEALTLHEAVPGHHLQIGLAREMTGAPDFLSAMQVTAFTEGWGLYSESLGAEMGFYKDPYAQFGRLNFDMWRACRLVVDTGLHAFDWPRDRAIEYLRANTSLAEKIIVTEIDRYIAEPAQALGYKIGELKFHEMRARAERELGPRFEVKAFHDALLANGAMPLEILESEMRRWLDRTKAK